MGSLSNLYISQSYQSLIHLATDSTASISFIGLQDGLGNNLGISVNTIGEISASGNIYAPNLTGSFNSSSLLTTASANVNVLTFTKGDGSTFDVTIIASGSVVPGTISGSQQIIALGFLQTSSFNAYTSSNDSKVNSLIAVTASYSNSIASLNSYTQSNDTKWNTLGGQSGSWITESETGSFALSASVAAVDAAQDVKISALSAATSSYVTETESGSFLITASFNNSTRNLTFTKGDTSTFSVNIPDVSGSTINTASFATTGSNTFFGVQYISGALSSYSGSNPGPNPFPTALVVSGSIMPSVTNAFDLGNDDFKFNSLTVNGQIKAGFLNINSRCNLGTVILNNESLPVSNLSSREIIGNGQNADTHLYYGTSSTNVNGLREIAYIQSGSNANLAAYAITGSNVFTGSQVISGSLYMPSSSVFAENTGSQLVTWDKTTGQFAHTPYKSTLAALFDLGYFYSTTTQSGSANQSGSFRFDTKLPINEINLVSGSQIHIPTPAWFNFQFSVQIVNGAGSADVAVWLKKNGANVADTATYITIPSNEKAVLALNIWDQATSTTDYYELAYQSTTNNTTYAYVAATGNIPASPAIILSVNQLR